MIHLVLVFILNAVCASAFTLSKVLLQYCSPFFLVAIRMLLGGAGLLAYCRFFTTQPFVIKRNDRKYFFLMGFAGIYLAYVLELWSMQFVTGAKTAFLFNLSPFFIALYSYYLFSERITSKKIVGMVIGFLGMIPMLTADAQAEVLNGALTLSLPEMLILLAVGLFAVAMVMLKLLMQRGYSSMFINGIAMFGGGLITLFTTFVVEGVPVVPTAQTFWFALALIILLGNIIFYNLYGYLTKFFTATFVSFTGFTIPFFTALYDWLVFGNVVGAEFIISSALVIVGLCIFYSDELRHGYVK